MLGQGYLHDSDNPSYRSLGAGLLRCAQLVGDEKAVGEFRATASPLPENTQKVFDDAVAEVKTEKLVIANDIMQKPELVLSLPGWLGIPEYGWRERGVAGHAQRTMVPKARGERQKPLMTERSIPIPCTWDDFNFDIREQRYSERIGLPHDVTGARLATQNVNAAVEDAIIHGMGLQIHGKTAPGLLNAPNVNSDTFVDNEAWTAAGHSGEDIVGDVMALIDILVGDMYDGPYWLYVPTNYGLKIAGDYKASSTDTILSRLQAIDIGGGTNLTVRVAPKLPANTVVMFQPTPDVVKMVVGQTPVLMSWSDGPGFETSYMVLSCIVPMVRSSADGKSGIIVATPT